MIGKAAEYVLGDQPEICPANEWSLAQIRLPKPFEEKTQVKCGFLLFEAPRGQIGFHVIVTQDCQYYKGTYHLPLDQEVIQVKQAVNIEISRSGFLNLDLQQK
jgi:hypothetical protein